MVVLPAGDFSMGSPTTEKDRFGGEGPRHPVNIPKPFAVGCFEVTRKQFVHFIRETGHVPERGCRAWDADKNKWRTNKKKSWKDPGFAYTEDHPQNCISWHDAQADIDWLSRRTGKPYRLLSEAEWEYAARGGAEARRHWGRIATTKRSAPMRTGRMRRPTSSFAAKPAPTASAGRRLRAATSSRMPSACMT